MSGVVVNSIRGNIAAAVRENMTLQRGSGNIQFNLAMDAGMAGGPYSGWSVVSEITFTNPLTNATTLLLSQAASIFDAVNGIFSIVLASSVTTSANAPQQAYTWKWWRTDLTPDKQLLRYGQLFLAGLEFQ